MSHVPLAVFVEVRLRWGLIYLLLLLLILLPSPAASLEAEAFLALMDRYYYTNAWQVGDAYFQSQLSVKGWLKMLRSYRQPLGRVQARQRLSTRYLGHFETAPAGFYVQVEFLSTFANSARIEALVVHRDVDEHWRIAGYQLR